ncbi:MAG: hypothetical protein EOO24_40550, partial [Comamonadaceae bacterium]
METQRMKTLIASLLALSLAACALPPRDGGTVGTSAATSTAPPATAAHPLEDRIWDVRAGRFIGADDLHRRAAASRYVLLGETHDSEAHHARQLQVLQALARNGARPGVALEQFDVEHQQAITAAQRAGERDAERLADAGRLNRQGWRWPMYADLIAWSAAQGWPLFAANLSRTAAREIALGKVVPQLPPLTPQQLARVEDDLVRGHCGHRPAPAMLEALVRAQRARDVTMAQVLDAAPAPAVLIAGRGHVLDDRAVPLYLREPARA